MKVIEDKLAVYPPHAICRADVRTILSTPPPEWVADIKIVRLSAALPHPEIAFYWGEWSQRLNFRTQYAEIKKPTRKGTVIATDIPA